MALWKNMNLGLLAANLCPSAILLLGRRKKKGPRGAPFWKRELCFLLELGAYCSCVIRLVELVTEGIQGDDRSVIMSLIRLFVTEGLIAVYLLLDRPYRSECWENAEAAPVEYGICLLLTASAVYRGHGELPLGVEFCRQIGYLVLFLFLKALRERRERRTLEDRSREEQGRQKQRETDYMRNVDLQYQRTRELWHDLKNHIAVLQILAAEEKYGELKDYLVSFQRDVDSRMIPSKTGCAPVDALLGDKLFRARRGGIRISLQICDLSEMKPDVTDMCAVLGNLLDNSLEACEKLREPGSIEVCMRESEGFYYLNLVNTAPEPMREEGGFLTQKRDLENGVGHGLGLRSVERIAHRYGGSLVTDFCDGRFRAVVRMQNRRF